MAKRRNRSQSAVRLARRSPLSLGHTASPASNVTRRTLPDFGEGFLSPTVRPLIRTVLVEREPFNPPPRRTIRNSPTVQSRATGRSNNRKVRSPFLTAQGITPLLTERAIICAKRTIRREVLFATKRSGRGAKSPRRPRSKVRC